MAANRIKLNCFPIKYKLFFHKLSWITYKNKLKTDYEECHKLFGDRPMIKFILKYDKKVIQLNKWKYFMSKLHEIEKLETKQWNQNHDDEFSTLLEMRSCSRSNNASPITLPACLPASLIASLFRSFCSQIFFFINFISNIIFKFYPFFNNKLFNICQFILLIYPLF